MLGKLSQNKQREIFRIRLEDLKILGARCLLSVLLRRDVF